MANGKICSVSDCSNPVHLKCMCRAHYMRNWRYGSTDSRQHQTMTIPWIKRHVGYQGDDCLEWPFNRNTFGYGVVSFRKNKTSKIASRIMCEEAHGAPPTDQYYHAAHSCGNGHLGCINPRHLSWKTVLENAADKVRHARIRREKRSLVPS